MTLPRFRAMLLGAGAAGLRPLGVAVYAMLLGWIDPTLETSMGVAGLAAAAAAALAMARALLDELFDPTNPNRLLIEDVSAAGLFHDALRRMAVWMAVMVPLLIVWPLLGYRPEVRGSLWSLFKLGIAYLVLSRLVQKQRVVRLIRAEAGSGYRVLREVVSGTYELLSLFVLTVLFLWGVGHTELAGFLTRAGLFTALFALLAAAGWSLFDRVMVDQEDGATRSTADLGEDIPEHLRRSHETMVRWTSKDIGRFLCKLVLASLSLLGLYFAWGGNVEGLEMIYRAYHATGNIGGLQVSLARLVEALLYVLVCLGLSGLLRNFLDRSVWPNTPIDRGISHAVNTVLHYLMIGLAGLLIIDVLGIGSESIKWFAGFIGIGVGFGMQTIVNNLASGIILLAERPIKPGDRVRVGTFEGEVTKISVRATTIKGLDNIETIVPNSEFVGSPVVNWSFSDPNVRLEVPVGVAYGSDIRLVKDALLTVAKNHRLILKRPSPEVRFLSFGSSSLDFCLLVWVGYPFLMPRIQSDLNFAIDAEFRRRRIKIPFPQRDLHLVSGVLPVRQMEDDGAEGEVSEADLPTSPPKPSLPG